MSLASYQLLHPASTARILPFFRRMSRGARAGQAVFPRLFSLAGSARLAGRAQVRGKEIVVREPGWRFLAPGYAVARTGAEANEPTPNIARAASHPVAPASLGVREPRRAISPVEVLNRADGARSLAGARPDLDVIPVREPRLAVFPRLAVCGPSETGSLLLFWRIARMKETEPLSLPF